ncbi:exonuclease [Cupriavidus gilardii CR3]|uniref:Exonuclease n=2 Tax=Cupriavidus gilardii TaxID=82541 RepID=A0A6N1BBW9_9BURK|nr:lambda exonuclease family protein [Cupriavidus gilardii]ALD90309.1 exonuclease [Cupriavidus gilardii CR3]ALD93489.1 exonuclease [Cupriavidus gilardii CR3]KAB0593663.1 YqaJ viral recombinase family protein [Cupriavidus gilardii]KAB0595527.1 YqaJ viral recombinase family protein [Cupriavidus gilardii]MCT9011944.1 YqaJ viral recombinase family protein [Cupriavidus gilardii]
MSEPLQRTEDWRKARAGKITASRFVDVIAIKRDGAPTAARAKYMRELAFERLSGEPMHEVGGKALTWGTEVEQYAREAFELETGLIVEPAQFVTHPDYPFIGCSADGLIGKDGGYESKCPMDESVHIQTWLEGMPRDHMAQVQGCMFVTGRKWWEFTSYDPRACERLRLYHERIERDEGFIANLEAALLQFEAELQQMVAELERKSA